MYKTRLVKDAQCNLYILVGIAKPNILVVLCNIVYFGNILLFKFKNNFLSACPLSTFYPAQKNLLQHEEGLHELIRQAG